MRVIYHIGRYFLLLKFVFQRPEKPKLFFKQVIYEMNYQGVNSLGIVAIMSLFMGAVVTLQTAFNIENPLIPQSLIGYATASTMILEFSPTIISLILAGKIGSNIASEIGTMRVSEQIDALEIMGINPSSYLILPKIVAAMLINPFIIIFSMALGIIGGYIAGMATQVVAHSDFMDGILLDFRPYNVVYALTKTIAFAFIITSVSGYQGYYAKGGSLEVGQSSTRAVVFSSIVIVLFNLVLTKLLLQ